MKEPLLERAWRRLFPTHYFRTALKRMQTTPHEPEMALLPALVDENRIALDIGAAGGIYCAHLIKYAKSVVAFEPRPGQRAWVDICRGLQLSVRWETVALSDR